MQNFLKMNVPPNISSIINILFSVFIKEHNEGAGG